MLPTAGFLRVSVKKSFYDQLAQFLSDRIRDYINEV